MTNYDQQNKEVIGRAFGYAVDLVKQRLGVAGEVMKQEAETILKNRNGYASGEIVKTLKSTVRKTNTSIVLEFGCYAKSDTGYPYASVVEYGRRAGLRPPPSSVVERWLYDKGRTGHIYVRDTKFSNSKTAKGNDRKSTSIKKQLKASSVMITNDTKGLAFIIARRIGEHGIKEKPFMRPAFAKGVESLKIWFK